MVEDIFNPDDYGMLAHFFIKRDEALIKAIRSDTKAVAQSLTDCRTHALDAHSLGRREQITFVKMRDQLRSEASHLTQVYHTTIAPF